MLCGTKLASCVAGLFKGCKEEVRVSGITWALFQQPYDNSDLPDLLKEYAMYVKRLAKMECMKAKAKSQGLSTIKSWNVVSANVPWQLNKWSSSEIEKINLNK